MVQTDRLIFGSYKASKGNMGSRGFQKSTHYEAESTKNVFSKFTK